MSTTSAPRQPHRTDRDRSGRSGFRDRPESRHASGSGRPRRGRDAGPGDHAHRPGRRGDGAPGLLDRAHDRRRVHRLPRRGLLSPERQPTIRQELSMALAAVLTQTLLPRRGGGRVPAAELLVVGYGARQHIRKNALQHLHQEIVLTRRTGRSRWRSRSPGLRPRKPGGRRRSTFPRSAPGGVRRT